MGGYTVPTWATLSCIAHQCMCNFQPKCCISQPANVAVATEQWSRKDVVMLRKQCQFQGGCKAFVRQSKHVAKNHSNTIKCVIHSMAEAANQSSDLTAKVLSLHSNMQP